MDKRIWLRTMKEAKSHSKEAEMFFTQCQSDKVSDYNLICKIDLKENDNG